MRKAVSPPLHPFPQAPLEIVRFGHVTLLTGRWILRLFKTTGCADLIGITPFNKKTYSSHTSNGGRSTHQNVRTGHHASASTSPAETSAGEVTVLRAATEDCHFPSVRSPIYPFKNSYISLSSGGHPST